MDLLRKSARSRAKSCALTGPFWVAVLLASPAAAQLHPVAQTHRPSSAARAARRASESVDYGLNGDARNALTLADEAIEADRDVEWGYYDRGDALLAQRHYDDALAAFKAAEQHASGADPWGKSIAIWGQANALAEAARCAEASPIYARYAAFVSAYDPAAADMARVFEKKQCAPPTATSAALSALETGIDLEGSKNYQGALEFSARVIQAEPTRGRGYYLRADALLALKRYDEAVQAYRDAEQRSDAGDRQSKAVAIWGQANALKEAGRCDEASPIYKRYAAFVQSYDGEAAQMGLTYSQKTCVPIVRR